MIIRLTVLKHELNTDGSVLINTDHITTALEMDSDYGFGTSIVFTNKEWVMVKETPKEIVEIMTVYKKLWSQ